MALAPRITSTAFRNRLYSLLSEQPAIKALFELIGEETYLEWGHTVGITVDRELRGLAPPVPSSSLRHIAGTPWEELFLVSGLRDASAIIESFEECNTTAGPVAALDFGCGAGRILRYTKALPGYSVAGCDVNPDSVKWCQDNFIEVNVAINDVRPPAPFADESFDLVYSKSIFTHLPGDLCFLWLAELTRITKPSGCIILTVNGYAAIGLLAADPVLCEQFNLKLEQLREVEQSLEQSGLFFRNYPTYVLEGAKAGEQYGTTFLDEKRLREWGRQSGLLLESIRPGRASGLQDIVVLKRGGKPGAGFDEDSYLARYPDVAAAVRAGHFESGRQHFNLIGRSEGRIGSPRRV
ncbi:MAG TPA: class I SAM-dependent methyltransferase [Stellaceae bacterium]|nr:class I SAM-dependent methyltransferase [Stellaceae bacterium]